MTGDGARCGTGSSVQGEMTRARRSLAGGAVEQLTGGVGVAGVASGLVDEVEQDPAQVGARF